MMLSWCMDVRAPVRMLARLQRIIIMVMMVVMVVFLSMMMRVAIVVMGKGFF